MFIRRIIKAGQFSALGNCFAGTTIDWLLNDTFILARCFDGLQNQILRAVDVGELRNRGLEIVVRFHAMGAIGHVCSAVVAIGSWLGSLAKLAALHQNGSRQYFAASALCSFSFNLPTPLEHNSESTACFSCSTMLLHSEERVCLL
jgi:hypothetical protein